MKTFSRQCFFISAAWLGLILLPAQGQVTPAVTAPPGQPDPVPVVAAPEDTDDFTIRLGGFFLSSIKINLSLSDEAGHGGQDLDFDKDLGGDNSLNLFRADAEWRIAARHKLQLSFFDIKLTSSHVIDKTINWGDQTYPINTTINTEFRTTIYKVNYGYTFYRNESKTQEITGLIGFHVTQFKTSLSGASSGKAEGVSVTAPLPLFGLEWKARLTDKLTSYVAYEYFGLSVDDKFRGNLSDFQAVLDYQFARRWTVGAGYNRYTIRASVENDNFKLTLRHSYNGLMLFVGTSF